MYAEQQPSTPSTPLSSSTDDRRGKDVEMTGHPRLLPHPLATDPNRMEVETAPHPRSVSQPLPGDPAAMEVETDAPQRSLSNPLPRDSPAMDVAALTSRIQDIRRKSAVLSAFPWSSSFLLHPCTTENPIYQDFYKAMSNMERQLNTGSHSMEAMDTRIAMVFAEKATTSLPSEVHVSTPTAKRLSNILVAYRLVDVLHTLQLPSVSHQNPLYGSLPRAGIFPAEKHWPLENWVTTLSEALGNMKDVTKLRDTSTPDPRSNNLVPVGERDLTLQAVLFKALHRLTKQTKGIIMLYNLQCAAFHLSFMLKGYTTNEKLAVPNIPDNYQAFCDATIAEPAHLTADEAGYLKTFLDGKELIKLRHPLQAALLFSPLYLLSGRRVINNSWDQGRMLQLAKAFGNEKPAVLQRIELRLWDVLIRVATGQETIFEALTRFFDSIPQNEVAALEKKDRDFYAIGRAKMPVSTSLTNVLLSVHGESRLTDEWPLAHLRPDRRALRKSIQDGTAEPEDQDPDKTGEGSQASQGKDSVMQKETAGSTDEPGDSADVGSDAPQPPVKKARRNRNKKGDMEPPTPTRKSDRLKGKGKKDTPKVTSSHKRRKLSGKNPQQFVVPFQKISKDFYMQPVDVEDYMHELQVTFEPEVERRRVRGAEVALVDPYGKVRQWTPEFHFQVDLDRFKAFHDHLVSCNGENGMPRYLLPDHQSAVEIIPYAEYQRMSVSEAQAKFRLRHLVITDVPSEQSDPPIQFDEAGLQELTNWDSKIHIQDQSIPVRDDHTVQLRIGTLGHILENARDPDGAILNALSFPLPLSAIKRDKLASDVEAWRLTEGLPFCTDKMLYPTGDMRWGLASTAFSRHWVHVDSDGLATVVNVESGEKLWILYTPHLDREADPSAHVDLFLDDFDPAEVVRHWDAEAVLLRPGTRLFMKPNTPHAVFTTEHSIALGGHFYSFSNLQASVAGIMHCFAVDNLITNTEHPETRTLLLRMMEYMYKFFVQGADPQKHQAKHLPDLMHFPSLVDALSLCNYCILANVLDYNTYQFPLTKGAKPTARQLRLRMEYDYNALSPVKRQHFSYVRGLAINFFRWLDCNYTLVSTLEKPAIVEDPMVMSIKEFLQRQAYALLNYKQQAEKQGVAGIPNCTATDVKRQLTMLFDSQNLSIVMDFEQDLSDVDSFAFPDFHWRVIRANKPFKEWPPTVAGTVVGDAMFKMGTEKAFISNQMAETSNASVGREKGLEEDQGEQDEQDDANVTPDPEALEEQETEEEIEGENEEEEDAIEDEDEIEEEDEMGDAEEGGRARSTSRKRKRVP